MPKNGPGYEYPNGKPAYVPLWLVVVIVAVLLAVNMFMARSFYTDKEKDRCVYRESVI